MTLNPEWSWKVNNENNDMPLNAVEPLSRVVLLMGDNVGHICKHLRNENWFCAQVQGHACTFVVLRQL